MITAGGYTMGGTSQATPHVAGAIALLRANSVSPTESIDQTISRLKRQVNQLLIQERAWFSHVLIYWQQQMV